MIAQTILSQLGGNKFRVMTGAKHFIDNGQGLSFQLPRSAKDGIKAVRIILNGLDTYDVEFLKLGTARNGYKNTTIKELSNVYADQLTSVFESATGLATSL
jgi:hypothetical protein